MPTDRKASATHFAAPVHCSGGAWRGSAMERNPTSVASSSRAVGMSCLTRVWISSDSPHHRTSRTLDVTLRAYEPGRTRVSIRAFR